MDAERFDNWSKGIATRPSRRAILKGLLGGVGSLVLFRPAGAGAAARNQPLGTPCRRASECASFRCVDNVCCDDPCTGQCEACSAAGLCTTVSGAPRGNRSACPGTGACAATCDGQNPRACSFPGNEVECGASECVNGRQTTPACNGNGTCHPTTTNCGLFACAPDGTACLTSCATNADCVGQAHCAGGVCQGDKSLGEPCADAAECQHGHCVDGVCCVEACAGPCQVCNVAGNLGFCTDVPDAGVCAGGTCCGGVCLDTATDGTNCGRCGFSCGTGVACVGGVCDQIAMELFNPTDGDGKIFVDDDLTIFLNGVAVFADADNTSDVQLPIALTARNGDILRIVATNGDLPSFNVALSPLSLRRVSDGAVQVLDATGVPCCPVAEVGDFYDKAFTIGI